MVSAHDIAWQNKTIPGSSDFRGVLGMGLLAAWFYFVWQFLSLPPVAAVTAELPPLLGAAVAKGQYMPDCGMIIAGFIAFHVRREMRIEWDRRVAVKTYMSVVVTLIAYLAVGVALLEAVHLAGPGHALVLPWQDRLMRMQFLLLATAIIFAVLWPFFLYLMWTAVPYIGIAGVVLSLIYYGMNFSLGWARFIPMWPATALVSFVLGVCLCTTLFRGVAFLAPVRGPMILLGWITMLTGAILIGPALFFLGFLMVLGGSALDERSRLLPGERIVLIWSRTSLAIVVVQPALFTAWLLWGHELPGAGWLTFLALAVAGQLLALMLHLVIDMPTRRLAPAVPA